MGRRSTIAPLIVAFSVLPGTVLASAATHADESADGRPVASAVRVGEAPRLDGDILNDPAWARATGHDGFWQVTPDDGQPASERTEVRIIYTDTTLYVGVICYDRLAVSTIVASTAGAMRSLDKTDSFQIILDTFRDGQNGFVFGTNPAGIEYDGQVTREGQGGNTGGEPAADGAGSGFNLNWDAAWEVQTQVRRLRVERRVRHPVQDAALPIGRGQRLDRQLPAQHRAPERARYWATLDRQFNLYRLADAGTLAGPEVPPQRNLKLSPYALGSALERGACPRRRLSTRAGTLNGASTPASRST